MGESIVKLHTTVWLVLQLWNSSSVVLFLWMCLILISPTACQMSNITTSSNITLNTSMTMVSPGGIFEVGFISGTQSTNSIVYALAIWYAKIVPRTVVWVANQSMALSSYAILMMTPQGDLQISDGVNGYYKPVWTSNSTHLNVTMACIGDDGNLVLVNGTNCTNNMVWQSFNKYTDTILPNQRYRTSDNASSMFSWRNEGDWRKGDYSLQWLPGNRNHTLSAILQAPLSTDVGFQEYWRQDHVQRIQLSPEGILESFDYKSSQLKHVILAQLEPQSSRLLRVTLDQDGNLRMYSWIMGSSTKWDVVWTLVPDCNVPGYCGPNVRCNNDTYTCITEKFEFIDPNNFRLGCKSRIKLKSFDVMAPLGAINYAFSNLDIYNRSDAISSNDCLQLCLHSEICQMVVTTTTNTLVGRVDSCWLNRGALVNGLNQPQRLAYIRVNERISPSRINKIIPSILGTVLVILCLFVGCRWFFNSYMMVKWRLQEKWREANGAMVKFSYREVVLMTENFGSKIGKGRYGTVYKGHVGERAIVVKRLKKKLSNHVEKEFVQEVESIGTIHHVHLVSLLGYCAKGSHRLLVYEFVERGSLDKALFRGGMSPVLDWRTRFRVAIQTARGLAYLHDNCKQRIIHCDVKPENILLNEVECAKVADFGLSHIMNQDQMGNTMMNIRGTYGYIAPEWTVIDGTAITTKVDVYSYGMVLLEIVSGRRNWVSMNNNFNEPDMYFPAWAFLKLEADTIMDVVDEALIGVVDLEELRRMLQVAFWCINEKPELRPSMNDIVQMLQGHTLILLPVKKPTYLDYVTISNLRESSISFSNRLTSSSLDVHPIKIHLIDHANRPFFNGACLDLSIGR